MNRLSTADCKEYIIHLNIHSSAAAGGTIL